MTQKERREWLITYLLKEHNAGNTRIDSGILHRTGDGRAAIPEDEKSQCDLLRSLMNVREPQPADKTFLDIQDEYLAERNKARGVTDIATLRPVPSHPQLYVWRGDITTLNTDAIVNAANSQLLGCFAPLHYCIDNCIHTFAGIQLRLKCAQIMERQGHPEPTGSAKITPAYNLPAKYIIHTVGPIVHGALKKQDCDLLRSCYNSVLELAAASGIKTLAFCCISTGVFMFPNDKACNIAVDTVKEYLQNHRTIEKVVFNVFKDIDYELYSAKLR